jgi:hypothetical protein
MSRLPTPGGDTNIWGDVLNDFLLVEHNGDGTHRTAVNPDATTTTKGKLKLAGDLAGTADAPTVPALSTKANDTAVVHATGDETVAGIKTFTSSPIVPTPSTGTQAAHKGYVDTTVGAITPASIGAVSATGGGRETSATNNAAGSTPTVNLAGGNVQILTLTANATITLSGATNGTACSVSLYLQQDGTGGHTITWPASIKWPSAIAPTLSTGANKIDLVVLETLDGGATWFGSLAGADYR